MSDDMDEARTSGETAASEGRPRSRRPVLVVVLAVILAAESVALAGVTLWLVLELLTEQPASYETALAILVLSAIAAVFLAFVTVHTLRMQPWIRAAALTWQLLQIVIAIACFQGIVATPEVGWYLLAPAVAALLLLFSPSVVAATRRV